jgi:phosphotriesterase-related protein
MQVMTVRGPVGAAELGHTQPHEHVLLDLARAPYRWDLEGTLTDTSVATEAVAEYRKAGGRTIVEVTTADLGRDPLGLRAVSAETGVHIVMGTGWYRAPYYPEAIDRTPTHDLADVIIGEIRDGVGGTGIRPGVIGEIGTDKGWASAREERVFRAAARAQKATNLGLMTHTPPGAALVQLDLLRDEGVDLQRVAVGHSDALMDLDYHLAIAETGAFLSFDLVGQSAYPDTWRARHVAELLRRGLGPSLLLSMDLCHRSRLKPWGGPGYGYLLDVFLPLLRNAGASAEQVHELTVSNPARFLSGEAV